MMYWFFVSVVLWSTPWSTVMCVFGFVLMYYAQLATDAFCISHQRVCMWNWKEHDIFLYRNIILFNHAMKLATWPCHLAVCCFALPTTTIVVWIAQPFYMSVCNFIAFFSILTFALCILLHIGTVVLPWHIVGQCICACLSLIFCRTAFRIMQVCVLLGYLFKIQVAVSLSVQTRCFCSCLFSF